jgi:flagellar hook-associated protein 2
MPEGLDLGLSGLASGFDWRALVDQLVDVERAPQRRLFSEQQDLQTRKTAYNSIATQLSVLQNRVDELNDGELFDSRLAKSSSEEIATALAASGAALGTYAYHIIQLATASVRIGSANIARAISATPDVSALKLSDIPFPTAVGGGTFTVNGKQVTIVAADVMGEVNGQQVVTTAADRLQGVFDKISAATGGDITGTYDPNTDRITLASASNAEIVLGSATDTSNFLQVARLSNNGGGSVTSSSALGSIRLSGPLTASNLTTTVDDGGSGAGRFKINGVEIAFDADVDSISGVLRRINDSTAGVTASYDSVSDRFLLTSKVTGDIGIALEDVTGNFLAATGLGGSSLQRGQDLLYTVNGGGQLSSRSNTITEDTSGIEGLSVTVLGAGDTTVTVSSDTAKVRKVITDFIGDYNKAQGLIDTNTASSTDAKGKVTAGTLAGESDAYTISTELRRFVTATFASLSGTIKRLESFGITSNGNDDKLTLSDGAKLDAALATKLDEVKAFFTSTEDLVAGAEDGLAVKLGKYLERTVGDAGTLPTKQSNLDKQVSALDDQITEQERLVQLNRQQLINSFVAMEKSQQIINQQLQFLSRINSNSGSGS